MTNADVIRRMTDDELYEFLSEWECGDIDYAVTFCDLCKGGGNELNIDCDGCRKHWLTRNAVEYGGLFYWERNKDFTDRKTEQNCSEKPNNCETCKHNKLEWFSEVCDGCCGAHSHYEPKTEPHHSGEVTEMDEPQKCYLRESCDHYGDKQVCGRCREYNLYSHTKTEPQTERSE